MAPVTKPAREQERGADTADDQRGLPASRLARRQGNAAADKENGDQEPAANRHVEFPPPLPALIVAPPSIRNHRIEPLSTSKRHKQPKGPQDHERRTRLMTEPGAERACV